jgi:transposase-like protein
MTEAQGDITRKLRVFSYAQQIGNVSKACRYFGIGRKSFYEWKKAYAD